MNCVENIIKPYFVRALRKQTIFTFFSAIFMAEFWASNEGGQVVTSTCRA